MHPCYVKLLRIHHDGVQLPRTTEASCRHHRAQRPGRVAGAHFGDDKLTAGGRRRHRKQPVGHLEVLLINDWQINALLGHATHAVD